MAKLKKNKRNYIVFKRMNESETLFLSDIVIADKIFPFGIINFNNEHFNTSIEAAIHYTYDEAIEIASKDYSLEVCHRHEFIQDEELIPDINFLENIKPEKKPMVCNFELNGINIHGTEIQNIKLNFEYNAFSDLSQEVQNNYLQILKDLSKNI